MTRSLPFLRKLSGPHETALFSGKIPFFVDIARKIERYLDYVFDTKSFVTAITTSTNLISEHALQTAKAIRGSDRDPAIILHGIMQRSGTVYVGNLLNMHPDLAYPNGLWETPFLQLTGDILDVQKKFFLAYKYNVGKMGDGDFLPLFGASFITYLHSLLPQDKRMLLKVPSVQYLSFFFSVFPCEHLIVLVRDGRDVVHSTIQTWPLLGFANICRRWNRSAKVILKFHEFHSGKEGYWMVRFEDVTCGPGRFVREACRRFGLDDERYPYNKIDTMPVRGSSALRRAERVSWEAVEKPEDFNPVGRWQQWSARKKRIFKRIAGQSLLDLGYCENLDW